MSDQQSTTSTGMEQAGPRLRAARLQRGLTLVEVAGRAGLSKGFLSLVERGQASVSVPNLLAVCAAVGVGLGSLFDYPSGPVVQRGVPSPMGGIGVREFLLTAAEQPDLQVMRSEIGPGGGSGGAYRLETDTVFAYVLAGGVRIEVDGEQREVPAGHATSYPGRSLHAFENPSADTPAEVLWVFTPPLPRGTVVPG